MEKDLSCALERNKYKNSFLNALASSASLMDEEITLYRIQSKYQKNIQQVKDQASYHMQEFQKANQKEITKLNNHLQLLEEQADHYEKKAELLSEQEQEYFHKAAEYKMVSKGEQLHQELADLTKTLQQLTEESSEALKQKRLIDELTKKKKDFLKKPSSNPPSVPVSSSRLNRNEKKKKPLYLSFPK